MRRINRSSGLVCGILGLSCLISGVGLGAQAPKTVTLDAPGWSLKRICASISQQIGQEVEPHGDIVNDYLIVHIHNVPWPELQKKLAWVEYGKWSLSGNTLTLEQDKTQVQARIQQQIDALAKRLKETFDKDQAAEKAKPFDAGQLARLIKTKTDEYVKKEPTTEGAPAGFEQSMALSNVLIGLRSQIPLGATLQDIVESIPPAELAAIPTDRRVVFSTNPTSLQYAFSAQAQAVIANAIGRQAQFIKALGANGFDVKSFQEYNGLGLLSDQDTVTVSLKPFFGVGIEASLRIFDSSGNELYTTDRQFGLAGQGEDNRIKPSASGYGTLTPEQVQDLKSLASYQPTPPSASLLAKLRDPIKYDPLQIALDPLVQAIAGDRNVIISNDTLIFAATAVATLKNGNEVPRDIFSSLIMKYLADSDPDPSWIGLRSSLIFLDPRNSIPRPAYADLVQAIQPNGVMEFIPAMRFANACGQNLFFSAEVSGIFISALTYGQNPLNQEPQAFDIFRLVGSLDPNQISQAESQQGFDLSGLQSESLKVFKTILLAKFNDGYVNNGVTAQTHAPTIQDEPTYAFANSLPRAVLTITEKDQTKIKYSFKYNGMSQTMVQSSTAQELAQTLSFQGGSNGVGDYTHLSVAPQKIYLVKISYPGTKLAPVAATFITEAHSPETYNGWQNLPPDLKQQVEDELKKLKSQNHN